MRVSLCLWACLIASLFSLSGALDAGAALSRVGALIEQGSRSSVAVRSLLARLSARPNADLKTIYSDLEQKLAKDVEERIKKDHSDAQLAINSKVSSLSAKTREVVSLKLKADEINQKWMDCIDAEVGIVKQWEVESSKLPGTEEKKTESCQAQEDAAEVSVPKTLQKFSCSHATSVQCQNYLTNLENYIDNSIYTDVDQLTQKKVSHYKDKKQMCQTATQAHDMQQLATYKLSSQASAQRHKCANIRVERYTAMCHLGVDLQDKCVRLSEYQQLVKDIDAVNSGEFSHPDRVEEWRVTQIAKCLVRALAENNHEVDDDTLKECESHVNFERDVGPLDKKSNEVDVLSSADMFSCTESEIAWVGGTYDIKHSYPRKAANYIRSSTFAAAVTLDDGAVPFGFCSALNNQPLR